MPAAFRVLNQRDHTIKVSRHSRHNRLSQRSAAVELELRRTDDGWETDSGDRRWLEFIAEDGDHGRMVLQITASGGRASSQLQALRDAGYLVLG